MYCGSSSLRMAYRWPWMSTWTTRDDIRPERLGGSEIELVDLRDHLHDARCGSARAPRGASTTSAEALGASASRARDAVELALQAARLRRAPRARSARSVSIMPTSCRTFSSRRSIGWTSTAVPVRTMITSSDAAFGRCHLPRSIAPCSRDQRRDDGVDGVLHFAVGQRSLGIAERQPQRQADLAVRYALALIPIELAHRHERARRVASESCHERPRQASVHRRESTDRARSTGTAAAASIGRAAGSRAARRARRGRFRRRRPSSRVEAARGDDRPELADPADRRSPSAERAGERAAGRHEPGQVVGRRPTVDRHAERGADELGDALRVEEVDRAGAAAPVLAARPGQHPADVRRFAGRARRPRRLRTAGRPSTRAAGCRRARRRGRAGATAAGRRTSPTADWRSRRCPSARRERRGRGRSMNVNVTASCRPAPHSTRRTQPADGRPPVRSARRASCAAPGTSPESGRSPSAGRLPRSGRPRARRPRGTTARSTCQPSAVAVRPKPRLREDPFDVGVRDRSAEQPRDPARAAATTAFALERRADRRPTMPPTAVPAPICCEQRERAPSARTGAVDVRAALEARRGLGLEAELPARRADGGRQEPGALERDARRRRRHFGRRAAHDAGERDRALAVGDDEHRLVERARLRRRASSASRRRGRGARGSPGRPASPRRTRASDGRSRASRSW